MGVVVVVIEEEELVEMVEAIEREGVVRVGIGRTGMSSSTETEMGCEGASRVRRREKDITNLR